MASSSAELIDVFDVPYTCGSAWILASRGIVFADSHDRLPERLSMARTTIAAAELYGCGAPGGVYGLYDASVAMISGELYCLRLLNICASVVVLSWAVV